MSDRTIIAVNGIKTDPAAVGWTDRLVAWVNGHPDPANDSGDSADKYEYHAWALTRRFTQGKHTRQFAETLNMYRHRPLVVAAHSNGADLVCRAFNEGLIPGVTITDLHLISPACDADFTRNGLNKALRSGQVGKVKIWIAARDGALKAAAVSKFLFGWMGLGYGTLGRDGPLKVEKNVRDKVSGHMEPTFGHSDWFIESEMVNTFKRITGYG